MDERQTLSLGFGSFHQPYCVLQVKTCTSPYVNHESHCSLEVMDLARENGLTIVTFTPHCSHRLQPLVYGPLKKHYSAAVNEWNLSHPGRRITIYDLPVCFVKSFYKAFSYDNIESVNY